MKKLLFNSLKITTVVLIAGLISCAGPMTTEKMIEETKDYKLPYGPKSGKALIYVFRNSPIAWAVKFNIYVDRLTDDMWAGGCMTNQFVHCYVSPGTHTLFSKTEGPITSVSFNCEAGKIYYAQVNATSGMWVANPLLVAIDDISGKYYLMQTREGDQGKTDF